MAVIYPAINDATFAPFSVLEPVTPGTALTRGACRELLVGTAESLNYTDMSGTARTGVPVPAGIVPIFCQSIESGGTAANIWAGY